MNIMNPSESRLTRPGPVGAQRDIGGRLPAPNSQSQSDGAMSAGGGEGSRLGTLAKVSLSSISAAAAEAATFPIDAVKTRLQLHRSPGAGVIRVAGEFVRDGGMYRGLSPAVLRHLVYTPLRIVGYEHLRSSLTNGGLEAGLLEKAFAGGVSGIVAQLPRRSVAAVRSREDALYGLAFLLAPML